MSLQDLLATLTLERKVALLTGKDVWATWELPEIGLRSMVTSDGPSGVRGALWDERFPSLNLPSATMLASSWDVDLAHRYGAALATEARRKGVDAVLGPTINLHRSPLGGRSFEAFSEDPFLTARIAVGYVQGMQSGGVGATAKHYLANDSETERFTVSCEIDERTLREVYLAAFEPVVREAHVWLVMSSYNKINGITATESPLLRSPLVDEWGFDGVTVSDWTAARSLEAARAEQHLVMPGPDGPWGDALVQAVRAGEIDEALIDEKVLRILRLAERVGALDSQPQDTPESNRTAGIHLAGEVAAEGMVLLRNDGLLPLPPTARLAVIGQNAEEYRSQGGGSATVLPEHVTSPLAGLRCAFAEVSYALGAIVQDGISALANIQLPGEQSPGMLVRFLDDEGGELFWETREVTSLIYAAGSAPIETAATLVLETDWTPQESGEFTVGFAASGRGKIYADGVLLREGEEQLTTTDPGEAILNPPSVVAPLTTQAGRTLRLRVELDLHSRPHDLTGMLAIVLGVERAAPDPQQIIAQAASQAAEADVAVVVVGTGAQVESESFDRTSLTLPGHQDELVRAVAAANPRTVVVVNSGAPVELPWREEVSAIILGYFGGQEFGDVLADVLTGTVEPGGRLPDSWPATMADVPVLNTTPTDGKLVYSEGIHIGYRAWLKRGNPQPAYPFGFGLGYTTFALSEATLAGNTVTVSATNTGERYGKVVVQVYLSRPNSRVDRPVRWLAGFATARVEASGSRQLTIELPERAFEHWDVTTHQWLREPGEFTVHIGTSVIELPITLATPA